MKGSAPSDGSSFPSLHFLPWAFVAFLDLFDG